MTFCFCLIFYLIISTGQLKRQYKWSDEETDKNWSGKAGIQQKMADKCRNLNKSLSKKKNSEHFKNSMNWKYFIVFKCNSDQLLIILL